MRIETLVLIGVMTIIFLFINYQLLNDKRNRELIQANIFLSYTIEKHKESRDKLILIDYPEYGISGQDILEEIDNIIYPPVDVVSPDSTTQTETTPPLRPCLISKDVYGGCPTGTIFDNDTECCELQESEKPDKIDVIKDTIGDVILSFILSEIATRILLRLARILARIGRRITGAVLSRAVAYASRILSGQGRRMARRVVISQVGKKTTTLAAKKAATGPLTWATTFIEIAAAVFDMADSSGYLAAKQTFNDQIQKTRDLIDFEMQLAVLQPPDGEEPSTWPILMPIGQLYADELDTVISETIEEYFTAAIMHVITTPTPEDVPQDLADSILADTMLFALTNTNELSGTQFEMKEQDLEQLSEITMKLMNGHSSLSSETNHIRRATRDMTIVNKLKKLSTVNPDDIELYPQFSTENQFGISFSSKAVDEWNANNYDNYLNQGGIVARSQTVEAVIACYYSDEYRAIDARNPGNRGSPNMVTKYLDKPAPLCGPYGLLVHMCAGAKASAGLFRMSNQPSLKPSEFGVTFNFKTMHCDHTGGYCDRLALDFDGNSKQCKNKPGQQAAEFLFGETLVRGPIRSWDNAASFSSFITQSNGVHNEILGGFLLATFALTNPLLAVGFFFLGPSIQDLVTSISKTFSDKPIPEQLDNTMITTRSTKNIEIRNNWSFLYDLDKNKYMVSGPINFGV